MAPAQVAALGPDPAFAVHMRRPRRLDPSPNASPLVAAPCGLRPMGGDGRITLVRAVRLGCFPTAGVGRLRAAAVDAHTPSLATALRGRVLASRQV